MASLIHAIAGGVLLAIGWYWGTRLPRWALCAVLTITLAVFASQAKAQGVFYGDTTFITEGRKSRGVFYVDTLTYIGHKKVKPDKPWVYEFRPNLVYFDWWRETSACQETPTGSFAQYKKFRWFVVNSQSFGTDSPLKIGYGGYFLQDSMAFYIAAKNLNDKTTVMHEMTHGIQKLIGAPIGHYPRFFGFFGCGFSYPSDDP